MLLTAALLAVVAGSIVYSLLTLIAAREYLVARALGLRPDAADQGPAPPPISVLKPLSGAEDQIELNLRTFFTQRYEPYEILFGVRRADDPAAAVVEKLRAAGRELPARPLRPFD